MLLGVTLSYLFADVVLALVALAVGFLGALFYTRYLADDGDGSDSEVTREIEIRQAANDAERRTMALEQVRALTESVAIDVDEHNQVVNHFSEELGAFDATDIEHSSELAAAVAKMVAANARLQSRLEMAEQKIRSQAEEIRIQQSEARTDALTGLLNRRAFDDAIAVCLDRFQGGGPPCTLILLDVDHFKAFNDQYGHQAGDEVLRAVGATLRKVVKKSDSPCRYGGEEFAVVMPNCKAGQGRIAAERIREAIQSLSVEFEGQKLQVTASVGVAEIAAADRAPMFIRRADEAVYAAKEAGRNNAHWHDGQCCLPIHDESPARVLAEWVEEMQPDGAQPARQAPRVADPESFERELGRRVAEAHRFDVTLSVLRLRVQDYDQLKQNYGDALADLILDSVAGFIDSTLREMDLLARLGDGNFVAMLPGSTEKEASQVGRRIQTAISNCVIPLPKAKLRIAVDLGIATVEPADDARRILSRAEADFSSDQSTGPAQASAGIEAGGPIG